MAQVLVVPPEGHMADHRPRWPCTLSTDGSSRHGACHGESSWRRAAACDSMQRGVHVRPNLSASRSHCLRRPTTRGAQCLSCICSQNQAPLHAH
jgi:hypothetical protein